MNTITESHSRVEQVTIQSPHYPDLLRQIKDPPERLYHIGNIDLCVEQVCLAIVGARKATPYGKWAAYHIAKKAAEHGVTIVSGLASGIDSAAHRGALDAGGKTIAVLGCGIDLCYPASSEELLRRIKQDGLVLSEYEPGRPALAYQFPLRNRIISGLSQAVVIAEASLNSGSLITANYALSQGREVYAVPGNINSVYSIGTNKLIQDGATPIVVIDDILQGLGISHHGNHQEDFSNLGRDEIKVMQLVQEGGEVSLESLCRSSGKSPSEVGALVTILEMKGRLQTSLGKIFIAK